MFLFWLHAAEANTLARSWSLAAWTLGFGRRSLSKREELSASSFGFSWDEHTVHVGSFAVSASRSSNEPNLSCFVGFLARPWCPMYFGRMTQSFGVSLRLLPRKLFMSCPLFKESRTREGAEAAIEEELRPLADKPLLERTGGIRCSWCRCCVHAQGALFGVLAWCTAFLAIAIVPGRRKKFPHRLWWFESTLAGLAFFLWLVNIYCTISFYHLQVALFTPPYLPFSSPSLQDNSCLLVPIQFLSYRQLIAFFLATSKSLQLVPPANLAR